MNFPAIAIDRRRSITLKALAPLGEVSDANFVSLQKDGPAAQAADPSHGMVPHDFTADLHDFEDTAALIVNLNLVISVDTRSRMSIRSCPDRTKPSLEIVLSSVHGIASVAGISSRGDHGHHAAAMRSYTRDRADGDKDQGRYR